jgi:gliding motility-associated-like protein
VKQFFLLFIIGFGFLNTRASHIVGGELYYDALGNDQYRITLKLYRDCRSSCTECAEFGDPEYINIYDAAGNLLSQKGMPFPGKQNIVPVITNPCLQPVDVCTELAIYTTVVTLPPVQGGYDIWYQRCCRSKSIVNIVQDQGATYAVHIPGTEVNGINSSPRFNNAPPIFICNNAPLVFNNSATDPDGDQLVYSLVAPFDGATSSCPAPSPGAPAGCSTEPTPHGDLIYNPPFSPTNPMNDPLDAGVMKIDSFSGVLTCVPNVQAPLVVGVQVQEFRNGVLLSTVTRDFQFNVVQCNIPIVQIPALDIDPNTGSGYYYINCRDSTINFNPTVFNPEPKNVPLNFHWDFGIPGRNDDTSNLAKPSFTYTDTGTYEVTVIISKIIDGEGCSDTASAKVKVNPPFFPGFEVVIGATGICQDSMIVLLDTTTSISGVTNGWNWNFGDGTFSTLRNPTKQYQAPGNYKIELVATNSLGCRDTATAQVSIHPVPVADFTSSPVCISQLTTFTNISTISGGAISTYRWDFGGAGAGLQRNESYTFATAGTKTVTLIEESDFGCKDTVSKTVTVNPLPVVDINPAFANICAFDTVPLNVSGAATYIWFPGNNLSDPASAAPLVIADSVSLNYVVEGTDANGCVNRDSVHIGVFGLPDIDAGLDTSVCLSPGSFRDYVVLQATGGVSYTWSPAAGLDNTATPTPTATPDSNTTYYVAAIDTNGCENIDSVRVTVLDPALDLITEDEFPICEGQLAKLTIVDQGASVYIWTPGSYVSNPFARSPYFNPPATTVYQLEIQNYCYIKRDSVKITVLPLPTVYAGEDTTIWRDTKAILSGSTDGIKYYWYPGDYVQEPFKLTTYATPPATTVYYLYAFNAAGCFSVDTIIVTVDSKTILLLPTGFSPNGDGVNDVFRVARYLNIDKIEDFSVYDRWGQRVFITNDLIDGWDGTYRGKNQPLGTYVWKLKAYTKDGTVVDESGTITLIR